jgi:signal transduction histidine kinase
MYLSRPAAHLAGIRNTGLANGKSVADLFPGMESRIHSQNAVKDSELWDFTAEGRKRFFRITGMEIPAGGKLVTMSEVTDTAEHGMIAVIKNNLKTGIFMMDRDFAIQENYSPVLEDMMGADKLDGKRFTDLIAVSITDEELGKVKEHLRMVFDHSFDKDILDDINPLDRLAYIAPDNTRKVFQCIFIAVEGWQARDRILAAIYDITDQADTQEKLKQEERRNREPENIFELLGTDPAMFLEFQKDIESEFAHIDSILRSNKSRQEILMRLYHEMRLMRSNALAVGLKSFAGKLRQIESEIKDLRGIGTEVSFDNILHIAVEIENLVQEKEVFKLIINMVNSYSAHGRGGIEEFTEFLGKAVGEMAAKVGKKVRFAAAGIEAQAFEKLPMHIARKALLLLTDNCVASIEMPGDRISAGKDTTGTIRLSVKQSGSNINIKLADDGRGIDFARIKARALSMGLLSENNANDKNRLLAAMFSPAFAKASTGSLHLAHERIHYAGGSIKVQTQAGKGTVFSIMLPAKNTETAATLNPVAAGLPATRITKKN